MRRIVLSLAVLLAVWLVMADSASAFGRRRCCRDSCCGCAASCCASTCGCHSCGSCCQPTCCTTTCHRQGCGCGSCGQSSARAPQGQPMTAPATGAKPLPPAK